MPADTLTISLTGPLADEVRAAAEAAHLTPEAWAQQALAAWLQSWEEDYRRLEEPGENISLDEAFDRFDAKIVAARSKAK